MNDTVGWLPPARLSTSQERALAIALRLLEERLATIAEILGRDDGGVLYLRRRPRLAAEQAARIDRLIAEIRVSIAAAAETFRLPREERDGAGMIIALLSMSWQSLGEVDTRGMRAYGEADPRLGDALDPRVQQLMDLVVKLESAVAEAR